MGEEEATNVTAGIWGFLILFALAMACWFLYRSMNRHLRNVRMQHEADVRAQQDGGNVRAQQDGGNVRAQQDGTVPDGQTPTQVGRSRPEDPPG